MASLNLRKTFFPNASFCFVCGVDSTEIRNFLIVMIGSLVFGTLCMGLWTYFSGRMKESVDMSSYALKVENKGEE